MQNAFGEVEHYSPGRLGGGFPVRVRDRVASGLVKDVGGWQSPDAATVSDLGHRLPRLEQHPKLGRRAAEGREPNLGEEPPPGPRAPRIRDPLQPPQAASIPATAASGHRNAAHPERGRPAICPPKASRRRSDQRVSPRRVTPAQPAKLNIRAAQDPGRASWRAWSAWPQRRDQLAVDR